MASKSSKKSKKSLRKKYDDALAVDSSPTDTQPEMVNLTAAANKLFVSKEYSDFTIICNGRRYQLHKAIVCPQSDVFATELRSAFKEGRENSIDLSENDAAVVHCMIRYLYGFGYTADNQFDDTGYDLFGEGSAVPQRPGSAMDVPAPEEPCPVEERPCPPVNDANANLAMHSLILHVKVYIIADMYDIPGLKSQALNMFEEAQRSQWDLDGFVLAADIAYTWTRTGDSAIRHSVVRGFMNNLSVLTNDKWKAKLMDSGEMLYDITRSLAGQYRGY